MSSELEPPRPIQVDIDTRLMQLWTMVWNPDYGVDDKLSEDEELRTQIAAFFRVAYGLGYSDALREDRAGRRAELHRTHGYTPE